MTTKIEPITDLGPMWSENPADVTPRLERTLVEQRRMANDIDPDDFWSKSTSERNIAALEAAIERSRRNDAARKALDAQIEQQRKDEAAATEKRRAEQEADEKALMRSTFLTANPSASVDDFERNYPALREEAQRARFEQTMEQTRRSYGKFL